MNCKSKRLILLFINIYGGGKESFLYKYDIFSYPTYAIIFITLHTKVMCSAKLIIELFHPFSYKQSIIK